VLSVNRSPRDTVLGKPISDILVGEQNAFTQAMDVMKNDDSRSYRLRFAAAMGPRSKLARDALEVEEDELTGREEDKQSEHFLNLEGQGILIYDRESGELSHVSIIPAQVCDCEGLPCS
jgi:serine/threonine-protein kinase RIM15